jgi:putative membrane protein
MTELSATAHLWIKALHIISVIAWMAGLLYLPRLFVYHADAEPGSDKSETFKIMERRLLKAIINPAMIAALVFGIILIVDLGAALWNEAWIYVKLAAVLGLFILHGKLSQWTRAFAEDRNTHPAKFYRVINEVPTVLMIIIVIFAVVRPF